MEWIALLMFAVAIIVLLAGYPVAFSLGGIALIFAWFGVLLGSFDYAFLGTMPNRIFGLSVPPISIASKRSTAVILMVSRMWG